MAALINRHGLVAADPWQRIADAAELAVAPGRHLLLPLPLWTAHRQALAGRDRALGVWLRPDDEPAVLRTAIATLALIAVDFPCFTDGRGYSLGKLIRERYGYAGDLRAIGDILRDQVYFLSKCGFSSFALRADQSPDEALAALHDYRWSPRPGGSR